MEKNTSCRLSGNAYDTATEDSISMYYSFNGTENDKTLENVDVDSSVEEITIEETVNTIVKIPLDVKTPMKPKCGRSLALGSTSSSTPADGKILHLNNFRKNEKVGFVESSDKDQSGCDISKTPDSSIVENFSKLSVETITCIDKSVEIVESPNEADKLTESTDAILKDASTKMWPSNKQMETVARENDELEKYAVRETEKKVECNLETNDTLADKMVHEIRSLLQGTDKSKVQTKGKENVREDLEKINKSADKKITTQVKPSRLSTFRFRPSILASDTQPTGRTITPATRIHPNSKNSATSLSSGIPTPRDISSSTTSYSSLQSSASDKNTTRRSMFSSKRISILCGVKASLNSIPELGQKSEKEKKPSKRMSLMSARSKGDTAKGTSRFGPIAKTTLNSPVMMRKDQLRKSIFVAKNDTLAKRMSVRLEGPRKMPSLTSAASTAIEAATNSVDKTKSFKPKVQLSREDFICEICSRSFRVSSIFEAHKKTHNPSTAKDTNVCKFCDKNFAIVKALDKHLLENCLKIPLAERKKIKTAALQAAEDFASRETHASARNRNRLPRVSILPTGKQQSRKSTANNLMPPPHTAKVIKTPMAHSGVLKTPNKTVSCKPCEKTFDNVLSFAEHLLTHSNSSLADE